MKCPHFSLCAGCSLDLTPQAHLSLSSFEEASLFFKARGFSPLPFHLGNLLHWRTRAKLAVRGAPGKIQIGLFQAQSHEVLEIPQCLVHHPLINKAIKLFQDFANKSHFVPYQEKTGQGFLRYLQLSLDRTQLKIQLALVLNRLPNPQEKEALKRLWLEHPEVWHSLWINLNTRRDNVIFGPEWSLLFGEPWLWEKILNREIAFHPASFAQANPEAFETLLKILKTQLPENMTLVEFYAGSGVIGLSLLDQCQEIYFNELAPLAQTCFEESRKKLPFNLSSRLSFLSGPASSHLHLLERPGIDTLLVDPPRKGLDVEVLNAILQARHISRFIYISCGWESFKRDCDQILQGGFHLERAEAFSFFPGTAQLEILAHFSRAPL